MTNTLKIKSIHQFLPVLARHDAIGETVLEMNRIIKEWGYDSEIYVEKPIDQTSKLTKNFTDYEPQETDLIIYHHSIGSALAKFTSKLNIPKILFYHNIILIRPSQIRKNLLILWFAVFLEIILWKWFCYKAQKIQDG